MSIVFRALITEKVQDHYTSSIQERSLEQLPAGEVVIKVHYSSLNFKDALSASGNKGITKNYPHTPGIDASGEVYSSSVPQFSQGDQVICTGYDLGMNTWGGFSEYIRVPAAWVIPLPTGLSTQEAMIYGTSGFTAAQALYHILQQDIPRGECLVTGASGAVGSMAIALLRQQGYSPVALMRDNNKWPQLKELGAESSISSDQLLADANRPLLKSRWNAVVDTVGGKYLSAAIRATSYRGIVTCCGMIDSSELHVSIFPFILRGVKLMGLDSAECPIDMKKMIWQKLANEWKPKVLNKMAQEIELEQVSENLQSMLASTSTGKKIVKIITN